MYNVKKEPARTDTTLAEECLM